MGIQPLILRLQPYSLTWRNTNIQPHRTIFWWDEPQLTSVTELSEQKLPLVTPPTCTVISALSLRKKTSRPGSLSVSVVSPKVHRLSLSVQCAFTECRAANRQPAQDMARISVREARTDRERGDQLIIDIIIWARRTLQWSTGYTYTVTPCHTTCHNVTQCDMCVVCWLWE